jgi:uncharacterized protein YbjT (DUF2867 family)
VVGEKIDVVPRALEPIVVAGLQGVDTVVTTANSVSRGGEDTVESVDVAGNANLIDASRAAGVGHFVFTSLLGADSESPMPLLAAKGRTEQRLRKSSLAWTVLRPNLFMDTWVPLWSAVRRWRVNRSR